MKKNFFKLTSLISLGVLYPMMSFAFETPPPSTSACAGTVGLLGLICRIQELINAIVPVLVALGIVYFVWGMVQYVIGDSEEAKKKGKDRIIFGVIGLVVIISVWGMVNIVVKTFNLDNNNSIKKDTLNNLLPQ